MRRVVLIRRCPHVAPRSISYEPSDVGAWSAGRGGPGRRVGWLRSAGVYLDYMSESSPSTG